MAAANSSGLNFNKNYYSFIYKAPIWKGDNFYFWKDKLESYFLGFDEDLWETVLNGYIHPTNKEGMKIGRKDMSELQRKDFQNHHKARAILLGTISLDEYEKIPHKESAHDILESLKSSFEERLCEESQADMTSCEGSKSSDKTSKSESNHAFLAENDIIEDSQKDADMTTSEDAESSQSKSEQVFPNFTISELADSLSEMFDKYNLLKIQYKLQSTLVSEQEFLKVEISELKKNNVKLLKTSEKAHENNVSHQLSENKNISNEIDYNFQKFLKDSLYRSDLASSIYKVSRNYRYGMGYILPSEEYPKRPISIDDVIMKYTPLYSHFIYGHDHDLKYTSSVEKYVKSVSQPTFRKNVRRTNKHGPRKVWVPKKKFVDATGTDQSKAKLPSPKKVKWRLSSEKGKEVYVQKGIT